MVRLEISRRSFLKASAPFAFGLGAIARGQMPIERGRFSDEDIPLAREQLLKMVNSERAHASSGYKVYVPKRPPSTAGAERAP